MERDNIDFVIQAETELMNQTFSPSMNKIINSVLEYDKYIKSVALIVDGQTLRQNDFNQNIIDVIDIIDNDHKASINKEVNEILAEKKQNLNEMIITEAMKKKLRKGKAIIFVDTEENVIKKNDDLITVHKWRIFNKN